MTASALGRSHRHMDLIKLLLEHGAPLEAENAWGGTVVLASISP